jgi:hypothetical protein
VIRCEIGCHIDVFIGLGGSKSTLKSAPQYTTNPLSGMCLYNFSFCFAETIALRTNRHVDFDLMFAAVLNSVSNKRAVSEIFVFGL